MYGWDLLTEEGRNGMRGWYRKLRLLGISPHTAHLICVGTLHGLAMERTWKKEGAW